MEARVRLSKLPPAPKPTRAVRVVEYAPKIPRFDEKRKDLEVQQKHGWTAEKEEEVIRQYEKGKMVKDIAADLNLTYYQVKGRIRKLVDEGRLVRRNPKV